LQILVYLEYGFGAFGTSFSMAHPANLPIADRIVLNLFLELDRDGKKELTDLIASCKIENTLNHKSNQFVYLKRKN